MCRLNVEWPSYHCWTSRHLHAIKGLLQPYAAANTLSWSICSQCSGFTLSGSGRSTPSFFLWMCFKFYNGLQWPECICGAIVMNFTGQSAASSWFSHGREDSMDWSSWSKFPLCYARLWSTTVGDNLKMQWHVYAVQFEENFYRCASKLRLLISIISSAFRVAACLRWLISLYRSIFVSLVLGWNLNILSSLMGDPDISTWTK